MQIVEAFRSALMKYADFKGRANRPEYWWFYLATVILSVVVGFVSDTLSSIVSLALLVPGLAVGTRRLHDTGRSGKWLWIALTIVGIIPLVIWLATEGSKEPNAYGPPSDWTPGASGATPPPPMAPPQA